MKIVTSRDEFAAARRELTGAVGLVPTMGALHAGHAALLHAAVAATDSVVATIFVNPMQFGPTEDLARYPRTLDADLELCRSANVALVWTPTVDDVYPNGAADVTIDPGPLGRELEGEFRPTHFAGVLTVVAKFLNLVRPDEAFFGEKDYQQLTLIRRMAADLDLGAQITGVPTVRDPDGLALSSRNVYLSADERQQALALSRALAAGRDASARGATAVLDAGRAVLDAEPNVHVDYFELRSAALGPIPSSGAARLLVAARVGSTRLIDNTAVLL